MVFFCARKVTFNLNDDVERKIIVMSLIGNDDDIHILTWEMKMMKKSKF